MILYWIDIFILHLLVENPEQAWGKRMHGVPGDWDGLINRSLISFGIISQNGSSHYPNLVGGRLKSVSTYWESIDRLRSLGFVEQDYGNRKRTKATDEGAKFVAKFKKQWKSYPTSIPIVDGSLDLKNARYSK